MAFLLICTGYLAGSIPFAYLMVRRASGVDIRLAGSGNIGAANALRTADVGTALAVFALDFTKGAAVVLLARRFHPGPIAAVAGLAAVVGHVFPVWFGFRGGKGVSTSCGVLAVLAPLAAAVAVLIFTVTLVLTRFVSIASIVATICSAPLAYSTGVPWSTLAVILAVSALIVVRHRGNLARLAAGREPRIGQPGAARRFDAK